MQNSKLSFQYWFISMHLLTDTKKSFSAKEVQCHLGHNKCEPIWTMLHKLRYIMGLRDTNYKLIGEVGLELDEGFFETVSITRSKSIPSKRGKGSVTIQANQKKSLYFEMQDAHFPIYSGYFF